MLIEYGHVASVHSQEVSDDAIKVQLSLSGQHCRMAIMLDVVAHLAQGSQADKSLDSLAVLPLLVAVHRDEGSFAATVASLVRLAECALAKSVPFLPGEIVAEILPPAGSGYEFDAEAEFHLSLRGGS